jgi:type I restriction enzyme S subunit
MKILKNTEVSRTLAATRDLLLPKLMCGEIQLLDAEKALEAVA